MSLIKKVCEDFFIIRKVDMQEFDDSQFFMDQIRSGAKKQCQVLKSIKDQGKPFVRFIFEYDFIDEFKNVKVAGKHPVVDILNNERAREELKRVSRGNVQNMDEQNCRISVRMFAEGNQRIYTVDFKTMTITFKGKYIGKVIGVEFPEGQQDIIVNTNVPFLTSSVIKAYLGK